MADTKLRRAMEQYVAQQMRAVDAPVVVWLGLGEPQEQFAERIRVIQSMHNGRILAAVPYGFASPDGVEPVEFPPKLFPLLHPQAPSRYRVIDGGRGSAKSHSVACAIVLDIFMNKKRVLMTREIMRSLRESSQHLIVEKIDALNLTPFFTVTDREITCTVSGSEIIFVGLFANLNSLKSLENISLCWIEESESVSAQSLAILTPTIRGPNPEIWMTLNQDSPDAPVMQYVNSTRDDIAHCHVDFTDNPWFPDALNSERLYLESVDADAYAHIWLGGIRRVSDAIIFNRKWIVDDFTPLPEWNQYIGVDFGFSADPSAAVECYVADNRLYIHREMWGLHIELNALSQAIEQALPGSRNKVLLCDSARPETISFLRTSGHENARAAAKWPGSILDGISFLRSFEKIIAHPRCVRTVEELKNYSYKIDRLTGLPTTEPQDRNNHLLDSVRYALSDLITQSKNGAGILQWYARQGAADAENTQEPLRLPHYRNPSLNISSLS